MNYLTKDGVSVKLENRTCSSCEMLTANTRYVNGVAKTYYRCGLSRLAIRPENYACVFYPQVNQWTPDQTRSSDRSNAAQSPAK